MLTPVEMGALAATSIGGITAFWGQLKGAFARVESLVIVRVGLYGTIGNNVTSYLWDHHKSSRFGVKKYVHHNVFIKPKKIWGYVAMEEAGKNTTFWIERLPVFCSQDNDCLTLTYVRGTVDIEDLVVKSAEYINNIEHGGTKRSRYYVRKKFGKSSPGITQNNSGSGNSDKMEQPSSDGDAKTTGSTNLSGSRPIFWRKEDLGQITNNKPFENLAYDTDVLGFYQELVRWKDSKEWFESKGLPWRLGALLAGPPGTGKSSLARAVGQSLDMPIHSYDLTTMSNEEFTTFWQQSMNASPCIVLLEDLDRIFDDNKQIKTLPGKAPLTVDCLLNCISGVQPAEGILVLVTANYPERLDAALGVPDTTGKSTRPGRLDRALYIGLLSEDGRRKIAERILSDCPELIDGEVKAGEGETGAQFENRCSKLALSQYWGKFKVYGEVK